MAARSLLLFALLATGALAVLGPKHRGGGARHEARPRKRSMQLPAVASFVQGPDRVFKEFASKTANLQGRLDDVRRKSFRATKKLKAQYERLLSAKVAEDRATGRTNAQLRDHIDRVQKANKRLRKGANELVQENGLLIANLEKILSNISIAQEFANTTLETSAHNLNRHTNVQVLSDLAEQDEERRRASYHEQRLRDVEGAVPVSMLQSHAELRHYSEPDESQDGPEALMRALLGSLEDLKKEQNASDALMKDTFEEESEKIARHHAAQLDEQVELNATLAYEEGLHEKLVGAYKFASDKHEFLLHRTTAFQVFARQLGNSHSGTKSLRQNSHGAKSQRSWALAARKVARGKRLRKGKSAHKAHDGITENVRSKNKRRQHVRKQRRHRDVDDQAWEQLLNTSLTKPGQVPQQRNQLVESVQAKAEPRDQLMSSSSADPGLVPGEQKQVAELVQPEAHEQLTSNSSADPGHLPGEQKKVAERVQPEAHEQLTSNSSADPGPVPGEQKQVAGAVQSRAIEQVMSNSSSKPVQALREQKAVAELAHTKASPASLVRRSSMRTSKRAKTSSKKTKLASFLSWLSR